MRTAYETYGRLKKDRCNAILICRARSGDAHADGFHDGDLRPGWWDIARAGEGLRHLQVIRHLLERPGRVLGTAGPSSMGPKTGRPYGTTFPVITIKDMVNAQKLPIGRLGIDQLFAVAGGPMGGMQVLQWAVSYPDELRRAAVIATTAYSTPQQIAFNAVGRKAITSDPAGNNGDCCGGRLPSDGLSLARMMGHITYLSDGSMRAKFGRNLQGKAGSASTSPPTSRSRARELSGPPGGTISSDSVSYLLNKCRWIGSEV